MLRQGQGNDVVWVEMTVLLRSEDFGGHGYDNKHVVKVTGRSGLCFKRIHVVCQKKRGNDRGPPVVKFNILLSSSSTTASLHLQTYSLCNAFISFALVISPVAYLPALGFEK